MSKQTEGMKVLANFNHSWPTSGHIDYTLEHLGDKMMITVDCNGDVKIKGRCKRVELEALVEGVVSYERHNEQP